MLKWLIGGGAVLAAMGATIGIPCAIGWLLYRFGNEQGSWEERWAVGFFTLIGLAFLIFGPWAFGDILLRSFSGG